MKKVPGKKKGEHVFVHCPKCKKLQAIYINPEWYTMDRDGRIYPIFVCMAKTNGLYECFYEGYIQIIKMNK